MPMNYREEMRSRMFVCGVPQHDHEGLLLYMFDRVEVGGFLMAVLQNDLMEAFGRADAKNTLAMANIAGFLYNHAPAPCWGSKVKVAAWLAAKPSEVGS